MVIYSLSRFSQLQGANGNVEREDWPREKLLVRAFLALL